MSLFFKYGFPSVTKNQKWANETDLTMELSLFNEVHCIEYFIICAQSALQSIEIKLFIRVNCALAKKLQSENGLVRAAKSFKPALVNRTKYRINVNPGYGEYPMEMSFKF